MLAVKVKTKLKETDRFNGYPIYNNSLIEVNGFLIPIHTMFKDDKTYNGEKKKYNVINKNGTYMEIIGRRRTTITVDKPLKMKVENIIIVPQRNGINMHFIKLYQVFALGVTLKQYDKIMGTNLSDYFTQKELLLLFKNLDFNNVKLLNNNGLFFPQNRKTIIFNKLEKSIFII